MKIILRKRPSNERRRRTRRASAADAVLAAARSYTCRGRKVCFAYNGGNGHCPPAIRSCNQLLRSMRNGDFRHSENGRATLLGPREHCTLLRRHPTVSWHPSLIRQLVPRQAEGDYAQGIRRLGPTGSRGVVHQWKHSEDVVARKTYPANHHRQRVEVDEAYRSLSIPSESQIRIRSARGSETSRFQTPIRNHRNGST
jgi:hypothetical protein